MPPVFKSLKAAILQATSSLRGDEPPFVYRGENMVLRGPIDDPYFEIYKGSKDLGENYDLTEGPLTGTLAWTAGDRVIVGTATDFTNELHYGQNIVSENGEVFGVKEIVDDTHFIADRPPTGSFSGKTGYRLPQLSTALRQRVVTLTGNVVEFLLGHLFGVGSGRVRINGADPGGVPWTITNKPSCAIYDGAGSYEIRPLGYDTPPAVADVDVVTGGTKGMPVLDKHSFMYAWWSGTPGGTGGNSNFSDVVKKAHTGGADLAIGTAGDQFEHDFTTALGGTIPANAKGFLIASNLGGKQTTTVSGATTSVTSPNQTLFDSGPWLIVKKVLFTDLVSNKTKTEFLDSDTDLGPEVSGNNDAPPDAEFVTIIDNRPSYISCYGKRTSANDNGSNPGKQVIMGKADNADGAPAEWGAGCLASIIGFIEAVGRWFMVTGQSLEFVVPTSLLGQSFGSVDELEIPIARRPYWNTGASSRYNIIVSDDDLFGFSGGKVFTSVGNGDENVKKYELGAPMEDKLRKIYGCHEFTVEDPRNNQILFIDSASSKNTSGYWESIIYPYSKTRQAWLPWIRLTSTTQDMIVSGVATVDQRAEYLCGGRKSGGSFQTRTYRFDGFEEGEATTDTSRPWYILWQPTDDGAEDRSKAIHSVRPQGRLTNAVVQLHGAKPGEELNIANMETGTSPVAGDIDFEDSTDITRYLSKKVRIRNLANYAVRISGDGINDRLDELVVEVGTHGRSR